MSFQQWYLTFFLSLFSSLCSLTKSMATYSQIFSNEPNAQQKFTRFHLNCVEKYTHQQQNCAEFKNGREYFVYSAIEKKKETRNAHRNAIECKCFFFSVCKNVELKTENLARQKKTLNKNI